MSSLLSQFPTLNKTVLTASNQSLKPKPASLKSSSTVVKPAAAVSKQAKTVKPKTASTATNSAIGAALSAKFGLSFGTSKSGVKRKAVDEPVETDQVETSKVNQQVRVHDSDDDDASENNDFDDDLDLAALSKTPGFELDLDDDDDIELEKLLQAKPISATTSSISVSATRNNAAKKGKLSSVKAVNSAAAVVVFNDANVGKRDPSLGGAREWRTFMASDVSKLTAEPKPKAPMSAEDEELEKKDDENDRELMDLIRSSKLIEDFTASELTGRERRSYLEKKMIDLGAKKAPNAKAPFPMRLGMIRAEGERAAKRVQTAKDM
ncbi:hypothetical protein HDU78_007603, partial [Chytriomyces hyalinus]